MKISIVIPVFNGSRHLEACLDSIFRSTENVVEEVICVDDCSTDDSVVILEKYAQKHQILKIVHHPANKGTNEARRSGVLAATGDYVLFADSDDRFVDGAIGAIRKGLDGCGVDVLFFGFKPFDRPEESIVSSSSKARYFDKVKDGHKFVTTKESALAMIYSECRLGVMVWARAWRRDVLVSGFELIPEGWCVEQEDDCEHLAFLAFAKTVGSMDFVGYEYRYDAGITNEVMDYKNAIRYLRNSLFITKFKKSFEERFGDDRQHVQWLPFIEMNRQDKLDKIGEWLLSQGERKVFASKTEHSDETADLWLMYALEREKRSFEMFRIQNQLPMLHYILQSRRFFVKLRMLFAKTIQKRMACDAERQLLKNLRSRIKKTESK